MTTLISPSSGRLWNLCFVAIYSIPFTYIPNTWRHWNERWNSHRWRPVVEHVAPRSLCSCSPLLEFLPAQNGALVAELHQLPSQLPVLQRDENRAAQSREESVSETGSSPQARRTSHSRCQSGVLAWCVAGPVIRPIAALIHLKILSGLCPCWCLLSKCSFFVFL